MKQLRSLNPLNYLLFKLLMLLFGKLNRDLVTTFGSGQELDFLKALIIYISNLLFVINLDLFYSTAAGVHFKDLLHELRMLHHTLDLKKVYDIAEPLVEDLAAACGSS